MLCWIQLCEIRFCLFVCFFFISLRNFMVTFIHLSMLSSCQSAMIDVILPVSCCFEPKSGLCNIGAFSERHDALRPFVCIVS
jgi:hypothetical protein